MIKGVVLVGVASSAQCLGHPCCVSDAGASGAGLGG